MNITPEKYQRLKQALETYEIENNIPVVGRWGWFWNDGETTKLNYQILKKHCLHTGRFFDGVNWYSHFNYKKQ